MTALDFFQEAKRLEKKAEHVVRSRMIEADTFSVTLVVCDKEVKSRLHECKKDEFFYVLKGEVDMQVEGNAIVLKTGEGILVKAGEKHKHQPIDRAWMLTITKHPHKHKFYE